jgi:hypothetical protein
MDQRSTVLYLAGKEVSAIVIHRDLVATLRSEAINHSSMTRYLREGLFVSSSSLTNIHEAEPQFDDCDRVILIALAEQPFASI